MHAREQWHQRFYASHWTVHIHNTNTCNSIQNSIIKSHAILAATFRTQFQPTVTCDIFIQTLKQTLVNLVLMSHALRGYGNPIGQFSVVENNAYSCIAWSVTASVHS